MCGIAGIIIKNKNSFNPVSVAAAMAVALSHRGPDGEGFIVASENKIVPCSRENSTNTFTKKELEYIPQATLENSVSYPFLIFAHRRLSIIDLSEAGHQPMCLPGKKIWITYNGEIYNYIELKKELQNAGYNFISESDTEVILHAYKHWGFDCVNKFNGMWAFCIYDSEKQLCFASRDRLGVKPFYYVNNKDLFAFASEQKAFVKSGLIKAGFNSAAAHNYLINGLLETETTNFFSGVEELFPGQNLIYSIKSGEIKTARYYSVKITSENEKLSDRELIAEIENKLFNAVKLRLRSDVEVGACLSGGIDSSALCGIIHRVLNKSSYCFTSVFKNEEFNEEYFADLVAANINAKYIKTEPTYEGLLQELNSLIYSQDVPVWDTSTYAQFKVMELAKNNNIKVVIDGQGADELFAGYHHHFVAKWNNLFSSGKSISALKEISSSKKTIPNPFIFYAKEKLKQRLNLNVSVASGIFTKDFLNTHENGKQIEYFNSVNEQLINDIEKIRLKSFLKCEDRCGMWHGVESRTPFSDDVELIDFMFSFNGNRKIRKGVSKYLLREASKNVLPFEIYTRYDKRGFETPMNKWVTELLPQMITEIKEANFDFVKNGFENNLNKNNFAQLKMIFKLFVLSRWVKVFNA